MHGYEQLKTAFADQDLFEDKSWQLSPTAFGLSEAQVKEVEAIGSACLDFHRALETLVLRVSTGRNLLRNRPLEAPWVIDFLDRGKPQWLAEHARASGQKGRFPSVLRPDLLLTEDGFALTELDSVPGGIGLTAFLCDLYADEAIVGSGDEMIRNFHRSLAQLKPESENPVIAIVVSEEAATYRPEMAWVAGQLQARGRQVFCLRPEELFPVGGSICFDRSGTPEKVEVIYRFFELFDLDNIPGREFLVEAVEKSEVVLTPPLRPFQEEKSALALFHHHRLRDFWSENLPKRSRKILQKIIPKSWIVDPAPTPPGAVLDGPTVGGHPISDWRDLAAASQKERDLILKRSGFHETAWGARSVFLGSDISRDEWTAAIDHALDEAPSGLHVLQEYRKPRRVRHPLYDQAGEVVERQGRLRLCPYYFCIEGEAHLSGALATFCPPDKKIIHGMQDAALLPAKTV